MNKSTIRNLSQAYVMLDYMRELVNIIGKDKYFKSLIRLEHGTGTGFFGVSNTGSTDCIKERFRGVTDSLGQSARNWHNIGFISENCLGITERKTAEHRIEHTRKIIKLFKNFESEYIFAGRNFTVNELGGMHWGRFLLHLALEFGKILPR